MSINIVGSISGTSTTALTANTTFSGTVGVDDAVSTALYSGVGHGSSLLLSSFIANTNGTYSLTIKNYDGGYSRIYTLSSIEYINRIGYNSIVFGSKYIDVNGFWSIVPAGSYLDSTSSLYVIGGAANDSIVAPKNANSSIYGNSGDDTITCGGIISNIFPGAGTNTILGADGLNAFNLEVADNGINIISNTTSSDILRFFLPNIKGINPLSSSLLKDGDDLVIMIADSLGDSSSNRIKDAFLPGHMIGSIEIYNYGGGLSDIASLAAVNTIGKYIQAGTNSDDIFISTANYKISNSWLCFGGGGNDAMYAPDPNACNSTVFLSGDGVDTLSVSGKRSQYKVAPVGMSYYDGTVIPTNSMGTSINYVDNVVQSNIWTDAERIRFSDAWLAIDTGVSQAGGKSALLLGAVLGKSLMLSKESLIGMVIGLFDQGYSMQQLAGALLRLPVWDIFTGVSLPTNKDIATYLLTVVNGTAPSTAAVGAAVLEMSLESPATQGSFLAGLALSSANQTQIGLVGIQTAGLEYILTS